MQTEREVKREWSKREDKINKEIHKGGGGVREIYIRGN